MASVYAVSTGSYSDYRVMAIFERREDAQAHVSKLDGIDRYKDFRVEELPWFATGQVPGVKAVWHAFEQDDGSIYANGTCCGDYEDDLDDELVPRVRVEAYGPKPTLQAEGPDRQSVVQAVADAMMRRKAQAAGIT